MSKNVIVRYRTRPDAAEENARLLPEFAEFRRELRGRCDEPPVPSEATIVGSYSPSPA
jgi:hypothetical protein